MDLSDMLNNFRGHHDFLFKAMDNLTVYVSMQVNRVGGAFKPEVRNVHHCDTLQHAEDLVNMLDSYSEAVGIFTAFFLSCGCAMAIDMNELHGSICDTHKEQMGDTVGETWFRNSAHFQDPSRDTVHRGMFGYDRMADNANEENQKAFIELLGDEFLKELFNEDE